MSNATPTDEGVAKLRQERQAFIDRVRESERLAAADPQGYRRKLRFLVGIGYAYIGLILTVAVVLFASVLGLMVFGRHFSGGGLKIALLLGFFLFAILKSLWVKIEPPEGLLLERSRAPRLWQEVERIADRLGAPRPDEIRLTEDFNAAASQWPRFGIFGGYRSTLILGMPLLASFSEPEAVSVIAHEFGHFSGKHGRFGVWIYRVYQTWNQLGENLSQGSGALLFRPFVSWFSPRFSASSFVIRRQHEYEADRAAAEISGAPVVAATLARTSALADHQRRTFWEPFEKAVERQGAPATGFFATMPETIRQPFDAESARRRLAFALAEPTDYDDSHPSLGDRLASLGQAAPDHVAPFAGPSAAEAFFGDALPGILRDLESYYAGQMAPYWEALSNRREAFQKQVAELEQKLAGREPTEDEAVDLTFYRAQSQEPEAALAAFRELHARYPENATAAFLLGERLVEDDDPEGIELLRFAAEKDPEWIEAVRRTLAQHHARQGDYAAYSALRHEAMEASDLQTVAEGASVPTLKDEFLPTDLTPEQRTLLRENLGKLKGLGQAYAFRKRLPGTGEIRNYLFLVPKPMTLVSDEPLGYFLKQIDESTDFGLPFTLLAQQSPKPWIKRLKKIDGSVVFDYKAKG